MATQDPQLRIREQKIVLRDLIVACHIGITESERAESQRLKVSLEIEVEPKIPNRDSIEEVLNYGILVRQVRDLCQGNRAELLETLASQIAKLCLENAGVHSVSVGIEKLDRYSDVEGIGIAAVYERSR